MATVGILINKIMIVLEKGLTTTVLTVTMMMTIETKVATIAESILEL